MESTEVFGFCLFVLGGFFVCLCVLFFSPSLEFIPDFLLTSYCAVDNIVEPTSWIYPVSLFVTSPLNSCLDFFVKVLCNLILLCVI